MEVVQHPEGEYVCFLTSYITFRITANQHGELQFSFNIVNYSSSIFNRRRLKLRAISSVTYTVILLLRKTIEY